MYNRCIDIYILRSARIQQLICVVYPRPVTLLLVGLDNAGKTTAAKGIVGGKCCRMTKQFLYEICNWLFQPSS